LNVPAGTKDKIKMIVHSSENKQSLDIPMKMAKYTREIKLYAQLLRLSKWLQTKKDELGPVIEKYDDYGWEDFIAFYNKRQKERRDGGS
jgi:hypothetical protein